MLPSVSRWLLHDSLVVAGFTAAFVPCGGYEAPSRKPPAVKPAVKSDTFESCNRYYEAGGNDSLRSSQLLLPE
ncbi:MAG: hypothetical protein LUE93_14520 [Bacteroides sp.]|nr:hypothetical protein [Bacteroides sp.]